MFRSGRAVAAPSFGQGWPNYMLQRTSKGALRRPDLETGTRQENPMAAALPIIAGESGLARYLAEIKRFPMLEPQQEFMLAKRWREHGDRDAAHKLVTSHLRLVAKIATGYRGYGLPAAEIIAEGNLGLMKAGRRFEPEKGICAPTRSR